MRVYSFQFFSIDADCTRPVVGSLVSPVFNGILVYRIELFRPSDIRSYTHPIEAQSCCGPLLIVEGIRVTP